MRCLINKPTRRGAWIASIRRRSLGRSAISPSAMRSSPSTPDIQEHMEVVGSDGEHVGTVDHTESADCIVLTGDDPKAGGKPHVISVEWVDHVDSKVHLNKP